MIKSAKSEILLILPTAVDMLEAQKTYCTNDILKLSTVMDEVHSLPQKRGEMTYMNHEPRMVQGPTNYNTDYSYPNVNWYSLDITYTPRNDYWRDWPR